MKSTVGVAIALVTAVAFSGYSVSIANAPAKTFARYSPTKTETFVRQLMSDVHREKRKVTDDEFQKLLKIANQPRHESLQALDVIRFFGTARQRAKATEVAFNLASTKTDIHRFSGLYTLQIQGDPRWQAVARSVPESDSCYEYAQALLKRAV
jgi:hypothetical protein